MSNVSIFEKKWIDLVFEGKNKEYGAYKLRQESSKTTLIAFFASLLFLGSVSGVGLLLSSFGTHPDVAPIVDNDSDRIIVVDIHDPIVKPKTELPPTNSNTTPVTPLINNQNFRVAPTNQAQPEIPDTNPNTPSNGTPDGDPNAGLSTGTPAGPGGDEGKTPEAKAPTGPYIAPMLDVQPEYPGGMKKFYEYVGKNFDRSNLEDMESVVVNVSFVIEKDGSMTDIKVLRNPGFGLDKEAIRVLKTIKTKWRPGVKNGDYVRTQYTLPIRIQIN